MPLYEIPELDESDPNAGISDLEWRRAAFIQKLVVVASYTPDRRRFNAIDQRRFIAIALRAYDYRLHIEARHPDLAETAGQNMAKSLPPEWHEAWLWGYQWQPAGTEAPPAGSRAVLDAVAPAVREGILESLSELGVEPTPSPSEAPSARTDSPVVWRGLGFTRHSPGVWLTPDRLWKLQNAGGEPHWVAFLQFDPDLTLVDSAPTASEALDKLIARAKELDFKVFAALAPVSRS